MFMKGKNWSQEFNVFNQTKKLHISHGNTCDSTILGQKYIFWKHFEE